MEYTPGELADRWTIIELKYQRSRDAAYRKEIIESLNKLRAAWSKLRPSSRMGKALAKLRTVNTRIWDLESAIRNGDLTDLEEIGRRALAIRDVNRERVALVNEINGLFGIPAEEKIDHASGKSEDE